MIYNDLPENWYYMIVDFKFKTRPDVVTRTLVWVLDRWVSLRGYHANS